MHTAAKTKDTYAHGSEQNGNPAASRGREGQGANEHDANEAETTAEKAATPMKQAAENPGR